MKQNERPTPNTLPYPELDFGGKDANAEQSVRVKKCPTCEQVKPLDGFHQNRTKPNGQSQCKECVKENGKRYYENNRERVSARIESYRKANPEKIKDIGKRYYIANREKKSEYGKKYHRANVGKVRDRDLRYKYNLSLDDFNLMQAQQGGLCLVCKEARPLAVDHDHATGVVRGLLCRPCNSALGLFKESEATLLSAAAYIRQSRLRRVS